MDTLEEDCAKWTEPKNHKSSWQSFNTSEYDDSTSQSVIVSWKTGLFDVYHYFNVKSKIHVSHDDMYFQEDTFF